MKLLYCTLLAVVICAKLSAQAQELEQLRLDLEKLAQFKIMLSEMKSGYQTLLNGYNSVRDAGKSNFSLHQNYLDGLLLVSPSVKNNPAVARVYQNQTQLISNYKNLLARLNASHVFTPAELSEVLTACSSISNAVSGDAELLLSVLTPGKFRMSDGERSDVIAQLDKSVLRQLAKLKVVSEDYNKIMMLRLQNTRDMNALKRLSNR